MQNTVFALMYLILLQFAAAVDAARPLQTFVVKDYLNHRWVDELIHLDLSVVTPARELVLTDAGGAPVTCQFTDVKRDKETGRLTGRAWTVVTVEPFAEKTFQLRDGKRTAKTSLILKHEKDLLLLGNGRMTVALPRWPGALPRPVALDKLPAPLLWVGEVSGSQLGAGKWINQDPALQVKEATTTLIEKGPVRAIVRQHLGFIDGHTYDMTVQLADRQEAALISEDSTEKAPRAGFRFSMRSGLEADHILWQNQWKSTASAGVWERVNAEVKFEKENVVCKLRPWSFWWLGGITEWAGFYHHGSSPVIGVLALHPSHWSPSGWEGFDRTEIPVTAGPGPRLDLDFMLLAAKKKTPAGEEHVVPLHREWGITVGAVDDHVSAKGTPQLRRQLIKYSEFPLDEVKEYGFDYTPAQPRRSHPFLLFTGADLERVRKQAEEVPSMKAEAEAARKYIAGCGGVERTLKNEGWQAFYAKHYWGNYLIEKLPVAYISSKEPLYGELMAAAVKGLTKDFRTMLLEDPPRPAIGAMGPWFSETVTRLLFNYDLIAGTGLLTPDEEAEARSALLLGAYFLDHPDYWNTDRGLCSANPNMTSSILLPRGLVGLFLAGHPKSDSWLQGAEAELKREVADWISPGGAWIECPGYQVASLDGMFLLAQAIRNVKGRDYFAVPNFKATMEYHGFLLTPPDPRFPPGRSRVDPAVMTSPSIGDTPAGDIICFYGWMAGATAASDPEFSKRQQFFWKGQNYNLNKPGRAAGFAMLMTDPTLPANPPVDPSRAFPGFGAVLRTSWTDPQASYLAHRTGPYLHHYHDDYNSLVYYAKGAPLCGDFGNQYQPVQRGESWYHNRVSFDKAGSPQRFGSSGELVSFTTLRQFADYSYGKSRGSGNQEDHRHILMLKSKDPLGANYVLVRDTTLNGQPNQSFYWNLWCFSRDPVTKGNAVHFPGQFGVDLDVTVLSPTNAQIEKDHWNFTSNMNICGTNTNYSEDQYAMRVIKQGSMDDFFAVLYPRASNQAGALVSSLAQGAAVQVGHMEGTDYVLLSPGKPTAVAGIEKVTLKGEIAFVRRCSSGTVLLAILNGRGSVAGLEDWKIESDGPVSLSIEGKRISGESDGKAHEVSITLPGNLGEVTVFVDGTPAKASRDGRTLRVPLPGGYHSYVLQMKD